MKRMICLILTVLIAVLCCACGKIENTSADSEQLTYWCSELYWDEMVETIKRYNRWCSSHSTEDMKIKLIKFDDYDTMSERLNIEVMSGGGPDLFSNYMDLPLEKLMQNGAFRDLNELIDGDTAEDKIILDNYNQTIMDAGVRDGGRYCIPAFYKVDTLIGEQDTLEKYQMPVEQGFRLTFDNMEDVLANYRDDPDGISFMSNEIWGFGDNADSIIMKLINSRIDFENRSADFGDDFREKLELLLKMRERSAPMFDESDGNGVTFHAMLFNNFYSYSNPIMMERHTEKLLTEEAKPDVRGSTPILYSCFEKDENTYSAGISLALFVNADTEKDDKILAFLKYLLGEHLQNLYSGTQEEYWDGGGTDVLPVLNSAFEHCVRDAYNITDELGEIIGTKEALSPATQALLRHIEKINTVSLYTDLYYSYYDKNVAMPILEEYLNGSLSLDKFISSLASATKIYIEE